MTYRGTHRPGIVLAPHRALTTAVLARPSVLAFKAMTRSTTVPCCRGSSSRRQRGRACRIGVEPRRAPGSGAEPSTDCHHRNPQPTTWADVRNAHGGTEEQQRDTDPEEQTRHDSTPMRSQATRPLAHKIVAPRYVLQSRSSRLYGTYGHEQHRICAGVRADNLVHVMRPAGIR